MGSVPKETFGKSKLKVEMIILVSRILNIHIIVLKTHCGAMVKLLVYSLEGHQLKPEHSQPTIVGPLSKSYNLHLPRCIHEKNVGCSAKCHLNKRHLPKLMVNANFLPIQ